MFTDGSTVARLPDMYNNACLDKLTRYDPFQSVPYNVLAQLNQPGMVTRFEERHGRGRHQAVQEKRDHLIARQREREAAYHPSFRDRTWRRRGTPSTAAAS